MRSAAVRTSSWLRSSLFGLSSWLGPILISLAVTPYVYRGLGAEEYGLYALALGFVGYSFNLNIARAVTRQIAEARSSGQIESIPAIFGTGLLIAAVVAVLAMTAFIVLTPAYTASAVGRSEEFPNFFSAMIVAGATVCVLLFGQVFSAVLQGYERFDLFSAASTLTTALSLSVTVGMVTLGYGYVGVLAGALAATAGVVVLTGVKAVRLIDWSSGLRIDAAAVRAIGSHSKHVIGYQLLGNFVLIYERTAITQALGPEQLTYYVVPMMIGINFAGFVNSLSLFVFPAVTALRGDHQRAARLYKAVSSIVFVSCVMGVIAAWAHSTSFLDLWMGDGFGQVAGRAFWLQMIGLASVAMGSVIFQVVEGTGRPQVNLLATAAVSVVTIVLMVYPLHGNGIESFAMARAIGFAVWLPLIPLIERLVFGVVQGDMWLWIVKKTFLPLVLFGIVQMYAPWVFGYGWVGLMVALVAGFAAVTGMLFMQGFMGEVLQTLRSNTNDPT